MAKFVLQNCKVTLAGTASDVSSSVRSVEISLEADDVETTNFGSAGWRERVGGLKGGSVSVEWLDDVASGAIDSTIFTNFGGTALFTVRPGGTAAIGTSNPEYSMTVLVNQTSVGGAVGDLATKSVQWPITGVVTRGTT